MTGDWREERQRLLAGASRIVVKVGSGVLADAGGLRRDVLDSLAAQMAALRESGPAGRRLILVSSGAVAAGRAYLAALGGREYSGGMAGRQAASAVGQARLMRAWDQACQAHGQPVAQVLLTRDDLRSRGRFLNARNTFARLLDWGVLPIVNENDTVSISELRFGDNDCLAGLLLNLVEADLFINLTSAPGVLAASPDAERPGEGPAPVLPCIGDVAALDLAAICGGKSTLGTGGMYSKLLAARRAAQLGVPTLVLPGRERNVMARAAKGEELGTWIRPAQRAVSRRKFWLAYQSDPAGTLEVDAGAARALEEQGGSLLPCGVRAVSGSFARGALLRVSCMGRDIGIGLSNYSSSELAKIGGLRRHEVAVILGDAHYPEVIHRDNMLLRPAL